MDRARRLILGGVFTEEHFRLALEAVKIQQQRELMPRDENGTSALKEVVFEQKDTGLVIRFLCGFVKDDAVVYFVKEWIAGKEYGN